MSTPGRVFAKLARADRMTPPTQKAKISGVTSPTWPSSSSPRKRNASAGCQAPMRPPWRMKLGQPWPASQTTTGRNTATASKPASQGAGRRSHGRIAGVISQPEPDTEPEQCRGVLARHRQPGEQADRQPPGWVAAAEQARQRPQARDPEGQQRRIGGHQDAADTEQQRRIEQRRGPEAGATPRQQTIAGIRQQQRGDRHRQRAEQPHARAGRRRRSWCRAGSRAPPSADGRGSRAPARATRPSSTPRRVPAGPMRRCRGAAGSVPRERPVPRIEASPC